MRNPEREFAPGVAEKLGIHVYGLVDPRSGCVFYVGKGGGQTIEIGNHRLFDHFKEADEVLAGRRRSRNKHQRIIEIWGAEEDIDWIIIRSNLPDEKTAFEAEAAIIDVLNFVTPGVLVNEVTGNESNSRGLLRREDVNALAAAPVSPILPLPAVFIFPIQNALREGRDPYDATRSYWRVAERFRALPTAVAVGVAQGICRGAYQIDRWTEVEEAPGRFRLEGESFRSEKFVNTNWLAILSRASGFWQRGNYLIVEFDGRGRFRFLRGASDRETWFDLDK